MAPVVILGNAECIEDGALTRVSVPLFTTLLPRLYVPIGVLNPYLGREHVSRDLTARNRPVMRRA